MPRLPKILIKEVKFHDYALHYEQAQGWNLRGRTYEQNNGICWCLLGLVCCV